MKANALSVTENGERIRILMQMDSETYVFD